MRQRWSGPNCAVEIVRRTEEECGLDAIIFTNTGEVEGLLKSLRGLDWIGRWLGRENASSGSRKTEKQ
ncbi:hypothetical protein Leryth_023684 [Lithospermum erythrorhizon]|nr:hypothetical protein Leryth_023684 [Lithospermum erythrorhizon]